MSGNTIWQSGDSLNPTNMNNQTVSSLTILGTFSAGTVSSQSVGQLSATTVLSDYFGPNSIATTFFPSLSQFGSIPSGATVGGPQHFGVGMHYEYSDSGWSVAHTAIVKHTGATQTGSAGAMEIWSMQESASGTTQNRIQGAIVGVEQYGASWLTEAYALTGILGSQFSGGHIEDGRQIWATAPYTLNSGTIGTHRGIRVDSVGGSASVTTNYAADFVGPVSIGSSTASLPVGTSGAPYLYQSSESLYWVTSGGSFLVA